MKSGSQRGTQFFWAFDSDSIFGINYQGAHHVAVSVYLFKHSETGQQIYSHFARHPCRPIWNLDGARVLLVRSSSFCLHLWNNKYDWSVPCQQKYRLLLILLKNKLFHKTKNNDRLSGSHRAKFARKVMAAVCIMAVAGWLDVRAMEPCSSGVIYFFIFRF